MSRSLYREICISYFYEYGLINVTNISEKGGQNKVSQEFL